ncbi:MAG: amidase family protein [Pseudomonadota bacterium]|nr:amidase family protein [Pseudomonadota bacterium]
MDLTALTATQAAYAIKKGNITAVILAEALAKQVRKMQSVNALVGFNEDAFFEQAEAADKISASGRPLGPLHGVPLVIKDNIDVAGMATTAATPALAANVARRDAPVTKALRKAGAVIMAKANMHELAYSPGITQPEGGGEIVYGAYGATRNPHDEERSPAGSSTGTAAAIAACMAPAGLGTDTGGSVRNPAAWCGIDGFRPSMGRYSQSGIVPISWTRDTPGPLARSITDLALLDGVLSGEDGLPREDLNRLRLGIERDYFCTDVDTGILSVFEEEVRRLRDAGADIIDVTIPALEKTVASAGQSIAQYEIVRALPRYLAAAYTGVGFEELTDSIAASGLGAMLKGLNGAMAIPEETYRMVIDEVRPALQKAYADCFAEQNLDALIFPTTLNLPFKLQKPGTHRHKGRNISDFAAVGHNVQPASIGGSPGLTAAAGVVPTGLPAAIGFDGPRGTDRKLLAIGIAYEAIRPGVPALPDR